jgi:hypothetical protein
MIGIANSNGVVEHARLLPFTAIRQFPFMKNIITGNLTRRVLGLTESVPGTGANRIYWVIYRFNWQNNLAS